MAEEELYDLVIPPGVPRSVIRDIIGKYDVELVDSPQRLSFANMDGDMRNLLAFRGKMDVLQKAEKDMVAQVKDFIGSD
ncbi:MAG: hypothetical protein PHP59_01735 [Methanofollis sp.]|uniref:hypothetical protein n=1 Tax=Methanofollis sp. TaxID=2052835 RepID=UPI00261A2992|nr:hypothetical protein [Methanofollis sp.]MDD4254075.1 hypothetical protein [Methanofollis sp.]